VGAKEIIIMAAVSVVVFAVLNRVTYGRKILGTGANQGTP
jgi:ribose/xylose/arabinose/galactoside ABC-type transport system permease subunit